MSNDEPKAWMTTLLLCVFAGTFGVHRFYVGKTGSGVAQLLTLGGCGIWPPDPLEWQPGSEAMMTGPPHRIASAGSAICCTIIRINREARRHRLFGPVSGPCAGTFSKASEGSTNIMNGRRSRMWNWGTDFGPADIGCVW